MCFQTTPDEGFFIVPGTRIKEDHFHARKKYCSMRQACAVWSSIHFFSSSPQARIASIYQICRQTNSMTWKQYLGKNIKLATCRNSLLGQLGSDATCSVNINFARWLTTSTVLVKVKSQEDPTNSADCGLLCRHPQWMLGPCVLQIIRNNDYTY
jgi:hypothetical protein